MNIVDVLNAANETMNWWTVDDGEFNRIIAALKTYVGLNKGYVDDAAPGEDIGIFQGEIDSTENIINFLIDHAKFVYDEKNPNLHLCEFGLYPFESTFLINAILMVSSLVREDTTDYFHTSISSDVRRKEELKKDRVDGLDFIKAARELVKQEREIRAAEPGEVEKPKKKHFWSK